MATAEDGSARKTFQATVTTTDATVTTCGSFTMPDEASAFVEVKALARQSASANTAAYWFAAAVERESGTVAQTTNSPVDIIAGLVPNLAFEDAALVSATITIDVSGNDVRCRVTGVAATTIAWQATIDYIIFKP